MKENTVTKYMPQLDSLRTIAVIMVMVSHWFPANHILNWLPNGVLGVTLFFVLSGFLISQILLNSRFEAERLGQNKFYSIKQFYIRRSLRIFPIYYLTIFVLLLFNVQNIREIFLWFLFYVPNYYFYSIQGWAGHLSHLWSLGVEEQFYLLWPFIMLFIPRRYLLGTMLFFTFGSPLFRAFILFYGYHVGLGTNLIRILTPSAFDSFGLGAILALIRLDNRYTINIFNKWILTVLFLIVGWFLYIVQFKPPTITAVLLNLIYSIICIFLIAKASLGFRGLIGKVLELKPLVYLGKISYGLYLYHNFMPLVYPELTRFSIQCNLQWPFTQSLLFPPLISYNASAPVYFLLSVLIASISWFLVEKPINGLKRYFEYTRKLILKNNSKPDVVRTHDMQAN